MDHVDHLSVHGPVAITRSWVYVVAVCAEHWIVSEQALDGPQYVPRSTCIAWHCLALLGFFC